MGKQAKGAKGQLVLAYETNYGQTPLTPTAFRLPFNKNTLNGKQSLIEVSTITGRRDPVEPGRGQIDASGNVEIPLDARALGYWLTMMFGPPTTTGAAAPFTHVWKVKDSMPSASIEKGYTDISSYALYPGCKVSKFSLGVAVGNNELTANMDMIGAQETVNASPMAATPTDVSLARFNNFQAAVMEGGVASAVCRKFDLNIDFGLDGDTYCLNGQASRTDIAEGLVQVSGSIESLFKDTTLLNKAINGTESSLKVTFTAGANSLEILIPELIFERGTPPIDGPKGLLLNTSYKAYFKDSSENSVVKITMVNDVEHYNA